MQAFDQSREDAMPQNTERILTTHVGSLIRPQKLIEFWRAIEDGKPYDEAAFEACLSKSVAEVVRQQADIGIDIVSDGEFAKGINWAFYIFKRLSGITVRPATAEEMADPMASMGGGRDHQAFPEFYAEYDAVSGLGKRLGNRVVVNGPIAYSGEKQVGRDIKNLHVRRGKGEGSLSVAARLSAGRCAGERAAGRQDRALQRRRDIFVRARRRAAPGI